MSELADRERQVLYTIITEYIQNSEPVGSRNVSKIGPLRMSPATIRNIMGDLEEKGYLEQPHTSAGRIPTDLGYRYYIDHLVSFEHIEPQFVENLESSLDFTSHNVPALMHEFSKRLGAKTMGSLFDGSGGFPLAGLLDGIETLWASEVEPYPIAVTEWNFGGRAQILLGGTAHD